MSPIVWTDRRVNHDLRDMIDTLHVVLPRVVCAWCQTTMRDGPEPTSHGLCQPCADKLLRHEPLEWNESDLALGREA